MQTYCRTPHGWQLLFCFPCLHPLFFCLLSILLFSPVSVINLSKVVPAQQAPPLLASVQTQAVSTAVICFAYSTSRCSLIMFALDMTAEATIFFATTCFHLQHTSLLKCHQLPSRIFHHTSRITHKTHITHHTPHVPRPTTHVTHHSSNVTHHTSHITHNISHPATVLPAISCSSAALNLCPSYLFYRPQRLGSTPPLPAKETDAAQLFATG